MATNNMPKAIKRQVRMLADVVYERDLGREMGKLGQSFQEWQAGRISAFELEERIHKFHNGPARALYNRYGEQSMADLHVAYGLREGLLEPDEVPDEVKQAIANAIAFYEHRERAYEAEDTDSGE